jgi:outer membrane immunogenic protein
MGIMASYNYQVGQLLLGVEGDFHGRTVGERFPYGARQMGQLDPRAPQLRCRSRPVLCERRRRVRLERDLNPFAGISIGGDGTRVGWTIGAGLDYAFTNNWFTGLEHRYSRTNPSHLYIRYRS